MREYKKFAKAYPEKRPAMERTQDYDPIYRTFSESVAKEEASRCLQCPIDLFFGLGWWIYLLSNGVSVNQ